MLIIGEIIAMDRRGLPTLPRHCDDSMWPRPALDELPAEFGKEAERRIEARKRRSGTKQGRATGSRVRL